MTEFIKGRWYRNPGSFSGAEKTYGKFLKFENELWQFSEYINNGVLEDPLKSSWWSFSKNSSVYPPLEDLSEIQPYLPEGHPDKKFVLPENFYIRVTEENQPVLAKWLEMSHPHYLTSAHIAGITLKNNGFGKGYNPAGRIKNNDPNGYDFGNEITYIQFKKYVLNQEVDKEDYSYLIKLFKRWNIK